MRTIRWGVMGTASIAVRKVIPAIRASPSGIFAAIASRHLARAQEVAAELAAPLHHGSYQELVDDPEIDAIYIPLPNHLHLPWAVRALEGGKHVLCEKPIALDAAEARSLQQSAAKYPALKVMEAFMYRFHPRWHALKEMILRGDLGEIGTVHTIFSYDNRKPVDIRNRPEMGGGGLLDIGCYGVSVARWLFESDPLTCAGVIQLDPDFGVDRLASGVLQFGKGTATVTCATQLPWHQHVTIVGSAARVEIDRPFNPLPEMETTVRITRGEVEGVQTFAPADQYTVMVERFNQAIITDGPVPTPLYDAIANMVVLDALRASGA